jgi:hypothetical protein
MVVVVVSDSMFFTLLHPPDTSSESLKGKQKLKAKQKTKMQKKGTPRRTVLRPVLRGYLGGYLEGPLCVGKSEPSIGSTGPNVPPKNWSGQLTEHACRGDKP